MTTQQLIDAIKAATKEQEVVSGWNYWNDLDTTTIKYIDADAFLAAVEKLAEAEQEIKKFRAFA